MRMYTAFFAEGGKIRAERAKETPDREKERDKKRERETVSEYIHSERIVIAARLD